MTRNSPREARALAEKNTRRRKLLRLGAACLSGLAGCVTDVVNREGDTDELFLASDPCGDGGTERDGTGDGGTADRPAGTRGRCRGRAIADFEDGGSFEELDGWET